MHTLNRFPALYTLLLIMQLVGFPVDGFHFGIYSFFGLQGYELQLFDYLPSSLDFYLNILIYSVSIPKFHIKFEAPLFNV